MLLLEPSKVSLLWRKRLSCKDPHRKYVDNLDEEVLYDDVQCTSMDFDKQQQPPQPRPTKNAPNKQRTIS